MLIAVFLYSLFSLCGLSVLSPCIAEENVSDSHHGRLTQLHLCLPFPRWWNHRDCEGFCQVFYLIVVETALEVFRTYGDTKWKSSPSKLAKREFKTWSPSSFLHPRQRAKIQCFASKTSLNIDIVVVVVWNDRCLLCWLWPSPCVVSLYNLGWTSLSPLQW